MSLLETMVTHISKDDVQQKCISPHEAEPEPAPSAQEVEQEEIIHEKGLLYPENHAYKFTQSVTAHAVAKVDAIREEAMKKGWTEARLYKNRGRFKFPCGQDYGLVCFVDDDARIGTVTEKFIEIKRGANTLKFYNPDVLQPWLRRSK